MSSNISPSSIAASSAASARPLPGRVVLITGGASGLGLATAHVLGEAGCRLVLADVNLARAQDRAAVLSEQGIDVVALELDVREPAQCERAVATTAEHFGRIDALINNAATDVTAPLTELEVDDWRRVLNTNLFGPLLLAKYAAAKMISQGAAGHIVNIASTASKRAWPNASAYHATKWGLLGLSHALHAELRDRNISVCAIVAGGMRTPFLLDRFPDIDPGVLQDPLSVAIAIRFVLQQPEGSVIPEITVLPTRETSWP
jgi:NAD(P)-dependent dehydrogenase (short-subunit alcohol dehydrogenase family)